MTVHRGGCHCGAIEVAFESAIEPADFEVRACQCSFCRKHATLAVADPSGSLTVTVNEEAMLNRYRFGLETAEYLLCARCGVYLAAITIDASEPRAICIVNSLEDRARFSRSPINADYDAETREERIARRQTKWTPVEIKTG